MIPNGPGVCVALEGNISCADAMRLTGAAWSFDYQPVTACTPMIRAQHYRPESADGQVSGAWWDRVFIHRENPDAFSLLLNEPHNPAQDNWSAPFTARIVQQDWIERTTIEASNRRHGQAVFQRSALWAGFGCIGNVEGGKRWERDYKAAGGPKPPYFHVHFGATDGAGLRASVNGYLAHLDSLWGVSSAPDVIVSEVWTPPGSTAAQALDVLRAAFEIGRTNPRIKAWAWFSARYPGEGGAWAANDLLNADGSLTALGQEFRRLATGSPLVKPVIDEHIYFPIAGRK